MQFQRLSLLILVGLFPSATVGQTQTAQAHLRGYTPAHSSNERSVEQRFMVVPDASHARTALKTLTAAPHMAGSQADHRTAEYVLSQFRRYGLEAEIEEFQVELSEPGEIKFALLEPVRFSGPTREFVAEDPASRDNRAATSFNAFSGSGDVTSTIVYANYGLTEDFDFLRSRGISVEGKIVIVRYGECYRGIKAMMAERNKAAGLIIYSDPQQDGYHAGDVYPKGSWRPPTSVQRGSVLYDFIYPGLKNDGSTVPRIPVLPISYENARHILENLGGQVAPRDWQGGLPFTYHLGPGPAKVRIQVHLRNSRRTIWNVIAKIPGTQKPEEIVLAGNHRDAWAYGAVDPNSGTTAMLEVGRGLGVLLREGWRPRRSILLCSWDAEEPDEFGSTEWADKHGVELAEKAVAYLNLDAAVSGDHLVASATPSLKKFLTDVAADVPDPGGGSVLERANRNLADTLRQTLTSGTLPSVSPLVSNKLNEAGAHLPSDLGKDLRPISQETINIGNLGGGTDFVSFFDHLGIPSTDFEFQGNYGVYHSIFDNYRWMEKFGDPHFVYHVTAARMYGLEVLRLSDADILPIDYHTYGLDVEKYIEELREKLILVGHDHVLDFGPAMDAAHALAEAGRNLDSRCESALAQPAEAVSFYAVNQALIKTEKAFLQPQGLPGRPWYKHVVFAPSMYTGYEAAPLPGVLESADAENWDEAQLQLRALTAALNRAAQILCGALADGSL